MLRASDSPALEHRQNAKRIVNAITIDVEEYFQVQAFAGVIGQSDWQGLESRVERTMEMLLDCLAAVHFGMGGGTQTGTRQAIRCGRS